MSEFTSNKIEISVIIPTHNRIDSLRQLLLALNLQNISPELFEIIIVSNGNTESTYNILHQMVQETLQGHIHELIKLSVSGVSNARNAGLLKSKGKYIVFIDDDDLVSAQYLSSMYHLANESSIIIGKEQIFESDINHSHDGYYTHLYNNICNNPNIPLPAKVGIMSCAHTKLIPRALIGNARFSTKLNISEDTVFMSKLITDKLQLIPAPEQAIYFRRQTTESLSRSSHSAFYYIRVALICNSIYLHDYIMSNNKNLHRLLRLMQAPWRRVLNIK